MKLSSALLLFFLTLILVNDQAHLGQRVNSYHGTRTRLTLCFTIHRKTMHVCLCVCIHYHHHDHDYHRGKSTDEKEHMSCLRASYLRTRVNPLLTVTLCLVVAFYFISKHPSILHNIKTMKGLIMLSLNGLFPFLLYNL
jgi:hypothetical protein